MRSCSTEHRLQERPGRERHSVRRQEGDHSERRRKGLRRGRALLRRMVGDGSSRRHRRHDERSLQGVAGNHQRLESRTEFGERRPEVRIC